MVTHPGESCQGARDAHLGCLPALMANLLLPLLRLGEAYAQGSAKLT